MSDFLKGYMDQTREQRIDISRTLYCPTEETLGDEAFAQCVSLTQLGFMQPGITDALRQDVHNHVLGVDRLTLAQKRNGEVVGFMAAAVLGGAELGQIFHLQGIMIHPDHHGSGLAEAMLRVQMGLTESGILAFHTQSKRMEALGRKVVDYDRDLALMMFGLIGSKHLEVRDGMVVDVGRYGQCLYGDREKFETMAIEGLNVDVGDAMVFAGRVRKSRPTQAGSFTVATTTW